MCAPVVTDVFKGVGNLANDVVGGVLKPLADVTDSVVDYTAEKVTNTIKDVSGITAAENAAKKAQQEADRQAEAKRKELEALKVAREATAAQQLAQLQQMEADQAKVVEDRKNQETTLRAEQEEKLAGIRARGQAVTGSLKILSQQRKAGRTAQVNRKSPRTKTPKTTQASLKIASQGASGKGAGTNISV